MLRWNLFVKRVMITEHQIEQKLNQWIKQASWMTPFFDSMVWQGHKGLAYFDHLAQGAPLYWMGRSMLVVGIKAPLRIIKPLCQWAFTKSPTEEEIIRKGLMLRHLSGSKMERTAKTIQRELEGEILSWSDYGRVASRALIMYYVAWFTAAFVGSCFFHSLLQQADD